jgi:hypothetical protein
MGCNCKKNTQVLNNLNSKDHLNVAFEIYRDVVSKKPVEEYDDLDKKQVLFGFYSIYPNAKGEVTPEHAAKTITNIYNQNYGK